MPTRVLNYLTLLVYFKRSFPKSRINYDLPLKSFGYIAFVHIPNIFISKLIHKVEKCVS